MSLEASDDNVLTSRRAKDGRRPGDPDVHARGFAKQGEHKRVSRKTRDSDNSIGNGCEWDVVPLTGNGPNRRASWVVERIGKLESGDDPVGLARQYDLGTILVSKAILHASRD